MIYSILIVFVVVLVLYKRLYFRSVSSIRVSDTGTDIVSVKPNSKFFKSIAAGSSIGSVALGSGLVAIYIDNRDSDPKLLFKDDIFITSDVYIFRYSLGRFKSVNLADRVVYDTIKKFVIC